MAFAAHIRDPEHVDAPDAIEDRRMAIYRELFFNNIESFLANSFPVLRQLYSDDSWLALVRDFFVRHRAHTPLFPELPREFLQFVENHRGPEFGDPPFLLELAHYEWVELALMLAEGEFDPTPLNDPLTADDLLGLPLQKSPLAWLLSYNYPVHRIGPDYRPIEATANPTHLVVYRTVADEVKFLELNAVSARLLNLIETAPGTGRDHLTVVAGEMGIDADKQFVERGLSLLVDLAQRHIIGQITGQIIGQITGQSV